MTATDAPTRKSRSPNHRWTEADRDVVRREYQGTHASRDAIAIKLDVSPNAVANQVAKMGLAKRNGRRPWTTEEDEKLTELALTYSLTQVAKRMKRSINAVSVRMKRLGIHRRDRYGWFTLRETCDILGQDHHWVRARIRCGSLKATRHHNPKEEQDNRMWHIAEKDLRDFIRRHPQDLDGRNVDLITIVDLLTGLKD